MPVVATPVGFTLGVGVSCSGFSERSHSSSVGISWGFTASTWAQVLGIKMPGGARPGRAVWAQVKSIVASAEFTCAVSQEEFPKTSDLVQRLRSCAWTGWLRHALYLSIDRDVLVLSRRLSVPLNSEEAKKTRCLDLLSWVLSWQWDGLGTHWGLEGTP